VKLSTLLAQPTEVPRTDPSHEAKVTARVSQTGDCRPPAYYHTLLSTSRDPVLCLTNGAAVAGPGQCLQVVNSEIHDAPMPCTGGRATHKILARAASETACPPGTTMFSLLELHTLSGSETAGLKELELRRCDHAGMSTSPGVRPGKGLIALALRGARSALSIQDDAFPTCSDPANPPLLISGFRVRVPGGPPSVALREHLPLRRSSGRVTQSSGVSQGQHAPAASG
jgi:hypothetical protein